MIAFSTASFASSFTWLDANWNVSLLPIVISGTGPAPGQPAGQAARAFGVDAVTNGQVLNTDADVALAKSESIIVAPNAEATTSVQFERSFELEGSPDGWNVSLLGFLSGSLTLNDPTGIGSTFVLPLASIFNENGGLVGLPIGGSESQTEDGGANLFNPYSETMELDDGIYTIEGS